MPQRVAHSTQEARRLHRAMPAGESLYGHGHGRAAAAVLSWVEEGMCSSPAGKSTKKWVRMRTLLSEEAARRAMVAWAEASSGAEVACWMVEWWHGARECIEREAHTTVEAAPRTGPGGIENVVRSLQRMAAGRPDGALRVTASAAASMQCQPAGRTAAHWASPDGLAGRVARAEFHAPGELPAVPATSSVRERVSRRTMVETCPRAASRLEVWRAIKRTEALLGQAETAEEYCAACEVWLPEEAWAALAKVRGRQGVLSRERVIALRERGAGQDAWAKELRSRTGPTFTASGQAQLLVVWMTGEQRFMRRAGAQVWATLLGVPLVASHPVRVGLTKVTEAQAKGLLGQAVDTRVVRALVAWLRRQPGMMKWRGLYADLLSGLSVFGSAVRDEVGPEAFRYGYMAELLHVVRQAHAEGWKAEAPRRFEAAHGASTAAEIGERSAEWSGALVHVGMRCSPFSVANRRQSARSKARMRLKDRALEEVQQALTAACSARPSAVVLETVANVRTEHKKHWRQLLAVVAAHDEFEWGWQEVCPAATLGAVVPRKRVWIVGVRRQAVEEGGRL